MVVDVVDQTVAQVNEQDGGEEGSLESSEIEAGSDRRRGSISGPSGENVKFDQVTETEITRLPAGSSQGYASNGDPKPSYRKSRLDNTNRQSVIYSGTPRGPNLDDLLPLISEISMCFAAFFLIPGIVSLLYGSIASIHMPKPKPPPDTNTTDILSILKETEGIDNHLGSNRETIASFRKDELPPDIESKRLNMLTFGVLLTILGFLMVGLFVFLKILKMKRNKARKEKTPQVQEEPSEVPTKEGPDEEKTEEADS
ncbi:unnamed protein product [Notodromas monacha]|uniref:Uncharacterized protein n=1 Tax=Notodromas monacha TaxID=399045 RepID=A0A7R9BUU4_9CRUS|nr:unnamed protein product [Notodromas monacha]CAG0920552.1 unnamed protein product [Notodromas monacha]